MFVWQTHRHRFQVTTLQFPLFPRLVQCSQTKFQLDRVFACQPKCLQYIRRHGFDLNWWVDQGINFVSLHQQEHHPQLQQELLNAQVPSCQFVLSDEYLGTKKFTKEAKQSVNKEMHRFLTQTSDRIEKYFAKHHPNSQKKQASDHIDHIEEDGTPKDDGFSDQHEPNSKLSAIQQELLTAMSTTISSCKQCTCLPADREQPNNRAKNERVDRQSGQHLCCFVTEPLAPFRRQALALELDDRFGDSVSVLDCQCDNEDQMVRDEPWKRRVRVVWLDCPQQSLLVKQAQQRIHRDAQQTRNTEICGFTTLMQMLSASGVPLIGHNLLLDCMQCFDKFHGPLPESCESFVQQFHQWFPNVFDTKEMVLCAIKKLQFVDDRMENDTSLEHVYEVLKKQPFHGPSVESALDFFDHVAKEHALSHHHPPQLDQQAHQAGYDAYMTGCVFLRIATALGIPLRALQNVTQELKSEESAQTPSHPGQPQQLITFRNRLHVSHFVPHFSIPLDSLEQPVAVISEPKRDNCVVLRLERTNNSLLKTFHLKQFLSGLLRGIVLSKLRITWEKDSTQVIIELPSAAHVRQLVELRRQAKMDHGTARDPIPSIGCVEVQPVAMPTTANSVQAVAADNATQAREERESTTKKRKVVTPFT